jgi:hypothetical protein
MVLQNLASDPTENLFTLLLVVVVGSVDLAVVLGGGEEGGLTLEGGREEGEGGRLDELGVSALNRGGYI